MKRDLMADLQAWQLSTTHKPLILWGARQVGKTWLMQEFGRQFFKNTVYLNFDDDPGLKEIFSGKIDPPTIINQIKATLQTEIDPQNTLIIFDEIQECQRAKDALKYFHEKAPQYYVICAGSFLGVSAGKFPVGQVYNLTLYPLNFYEFVAALNYPELEQALRQADWAVLAGLRPLLEDLWHTYLWVGGMPEIINNYLLSQGDFNRVRMEQKNVIRAYQSDFAKHVWPQDIQKVNQIWEVFPLHLAREKMKFLYKDIKVGARARHYEDALHWLIKTGLVYKVPRIFTPQLPFPRYQERASFKLFSLDCGILGALAKTDYAMKTASGDYRGALMEQYVCQELVALHFDPIFYWGREHGTAELDFLIQYKNLAIPCEVKASTNNKTKSLSLYIEKYNPALALKISTGMLRFDPPILSVPFYLLGSLTKIIDHYLPDLATTPNPPFLGRKDG